MHYHTILSFSQLCFKNFFLIPDFRFIIYKKQGHSCTYPEQSSDDQVTYIFYESGTNSLAQNFGLPHNQ